MPATKLACMIRLGYQRQKPVCGKPGSALHRSCEGTRCLVQSSAVAFFAEVEAAHRAEDVETYIRFFAPETVWVTSRGACYRGRRALGDYLRGAIPGGLGDGSVSYRVESTHQLSPGVTLVVLEQVYLDAQGRPRDARARHTQTYAVTLGDAAPQILAGQNTVKVAEAGS
jgi:uncharacterized protein (TIGR02246 family)